MSASQFDRRTLLKGAIASLATLPAMGWSREAAAQTPLPPLDGKDPVAASMGYVQDASTIDAAKTPEFKPGSACANCLQAQGADGPWRTCSIFPGKSVNANGWCKVWVSQG